MANTTNFGWETPDDTDLVKDGAAAMRTLGSAIDTSMGDLKGGTTGQFLAKNSNTDMDFVWSTSSGISPTIVDAKGDLIAATAADTVSRLAVGTNGQFLTADSTAATGLAWTTASSGGLTLLSTTSMSGSSSVAISSISQSYKNLQIVVTGVTWNTSDSELRMYFGSSGTNVSSGWASWSSTNPATSAWQNDQIKFTGGNNVSRTYAQNHVINIYNYTSTSKYAFDFSGMAAPTGSTTPSGAHGGGGVNSTSALSTICFETAHGNAFNAGTIKIYGVN